MCRIMEILYLFYFCGGIVNKLKYDKAFILKTLLVLIIAKQIFENDESTAHSVMIILIANIVKTVCFYPKT